MKQKAIHEGGRYRAKVSGRIVTVRVLREVIGISKTRWVCVNEETGRQISVRSAQRFREPAEEEF